MEYLERVASEKADADPMRLLEMADPETYGAIIKALDPSRGANSLIYHHLYKRQAYGYSFGKLVDHILDPKQYFSAHEFGAFVREKIASETLESAKNVIQTAEWESGEIDLNAFRERCCRSINGLIEKGVEDYLKLLRNDKTPPWYGMGSSNLINERRWRQIHDMEVNLNDLCPAIDEAFRHLKYVALDCGIEDIETFRKENIAEQEITARIESNQTSKTPFRILKEYCVEQMLAQRPQ